MSNKDDNIPARAPLHIRIIGGTLLLLVVGGSLWLHLDGVANDKERLKRCHEEIRSLER